MDDDERIRAHLVSVWREARKRFSVGGREGMLLLTDRHLCFVQKTESKKRWWTVVVDRQALKLMRSKDTMIIHDGYGEEELRRDLENTKNTEVAFDEILDVGSAEKTWGSVLELRYSQNGKESKFRYTIARDWVKYPLKEPTRYLKVDWGPFVEFIRERRGITP